MKLLSNWHITKMMALQKHSISTHCKNVNNFDSHSGLSHTMASKARFSQENDTKVKLTMPI